MRLTLVRHATAIDKDEPISDDYRYLTPEGRDFFRKTARSIARKGVAKAVILTSPLIRAVQTADVLAEVLKFKGRLLVHEGLRVDFGLEELQKLLSDYSDAEELILVGHDPDFSTLAAALTTPGFKMKKGSALSFNVKSGHISSGVGFKWLAVGRKVITEVEKLPVQE